MVQRTRIGETKYAIARLQLGVLTRYFGLSLDDGFDVEKVPVARDALSAVRQTPNNYPMTSSFVNGGFRLDTIVNCFVQEDQTPYSPQPS